MAISASLVKELREKTGAGMMDCKKALVEVEGDLEKAVDWLRQKGMAKAAKKSGRATSEGLVTVAASADGKHVAMAALLCETDFVARGEQFEALALKVAQSVLDANPADADALQGIIGDEVTQLIASVGENMQLGKFTRHSKAGEGDVIGQYIHANRKIGVLVDLHCGKAETAEKEEVKELAKNVAMQVAATTWGPSGLLGIFVMTAGPNGATTSVACYVVGLLISYIMGFIVTNAMIKPEEVADA